MFELLRESGRSAFCKFDIDEEKMRKLGQSHLPHEVDLLHVCVACPRREETASVVADYVR